MLVIRPAIGDPELGPSLNIDLVVEELEGARRRPV